MRSRRPILRAASAAALAAIALVACGGGDDETPPVALQQTPATCSALGATTIAAASIGEPTTGAVVTSATYVAATPDTLNAAGTAIIQGLPDYCQLLVDIKPVDATAPTIKSQVNLPTSWNGKKLQLGGGGFNGTLVTGLGAVHNAGPDTSAAADARLPHRRHRQRPPVRRPAASRRRSRSTPRRSTNFAYAVVQEDARRRRPARCSPTTASAPTRSYYSGGSEGGREGDDDGAALSERLRRDPRGRSGDELHRAADAPATRRVAPTRSAPPGSATRSTSFTRPSPAPATTLDGIADGVVSNYLGCKAPADAALAAIVCPGGSDTGPTCLSTAQLAAVSALHSAYTFSFPLANGMTSYAGWGYGGEALPRQLGQLGHRLGAADLHRGAEHRRDEQHLLVRQRLRSLLHRPGPELQSDRPSTRRRSRRACRRSRRSSMRPIPTSAPYFGHGGKLILKEDMADYAQSPYTGLNYYDAVVAELGAPVATASFKAYVAPGLSHTSNGVAAGTANAPSYGIPGRIDWLTVLEQLVREGHGAADRTLTLTLNQALPPYTVTASKPLCAYPQYPRVHRHLAGRPAISPRATSARAAERGSFGRRVPPPEALLLRDRTACRLVVDGLLHRAIERLARLARDRSLAPPRPVGVRGDHELALRVDEDALAEDAASGEACRRCRSTTGSRSRARQRRSRCARSSPRRASLRARSIWPPTRAPFRTNSPKRAKSRVAAWMQQPLISLPLLLRIQVACCSMPAGTQIFSER